MGGRPKKTAPERRCVVTGESGERTPLVRFVLGPDGSVVPDVEEKLPGRGAWLTADAAVFRKAEAKNPFPRAFRSPARCPDGLAGLVADLLRRRCLDLLGLANGAGQLVAGYEKVRDAAERGPFGAVVVASDAGPTAMSRTGKLAEGAPIVAHLDRNELSLALGRENVVHAAVAPGRLAGLFVRDAERLRRLKGLPEHESNEKRIVDD